MKIGTLGRAQHVQATLRLAMVGGLLMLSGPLLGGCAWIKAAVILTSPQTEKVEPEFDRMAGQRVLVYVWVPPEVAWDYPKIRLDLAANLSSYLQKNVEDIHVVDPYLVEQFLENSHTPEVRSEELSKEFRAKVIIRVAVYKFTMRDPGMSQFYRGRLNASITAVDMTNPEIPVKEFPLGEVSTVVPEEKSMGYTNIEPDVLRQQTYHVFTIEAGKKFHEYERPLD